MSTIAIKIQIIESDGRISRIFDDNVNPSMLIRDLKRNWSDKFNVDIHSARFNNQTLSDDNNCNFYNIRSGSTVQLVSDNSISLVIEVRSINPNNRPIELKVNPNIKTEDLMKKIRNNISFDLELAYLSHNGETLRTGVSLRDQNVKNNDKIQVLMRTRGG